MCRRLAFRRSHGLGRHSQNEKDGMLMCAAEGVTESPFVTSGRATALSPQSRGLQEPSVLRRIGLGVAHGIPPAARQGAVADGRTFSVVARTVLSRPGVALE